MVAYGAFVAVNDDIQGLLHISQITKQRNAKVEDYLNRGQEVEVKIISLNKDEKKLGLALTELMEAKETEDVIMAIKECDKLCEQIHLPVQSGSDEILKKMNRHYDREKYMSLIKKIKEEIPECSITTDIIVGFPGETEENFLDTLNLCKEVGYDSAFTFIYSRRNHTPADRMEDQVPDDVKHERFNRLVDVINKGVINGNKVYEDRTVEVLVEGPSKNDETKLMGRTRNGRLVNFPGDSSMIGKLVNVHINRAQPFSLLGEIVE